MAPKRLRCFVVGCKNEHGCRHLLPTSEPLKTQWISFVFEGDTPPDLPKCVYVCSNHFTQDCFVNEGQYKAGFATKLILRDGSVPTVRDPSSPSAESGSSEEWAKVHHVACQTDTTPLCTVGTQLSIKTLRPHYKSTGTQTADIAVGSSQPLLSSTSKKRPNKRSRLELVEEEEDPSGSSSSMNVKEPLDSTYDPVDSVTALTKPTDVTMQSSKLAHKSATYIVYESCLLELFEQCPECYRVSDVRTRRVGTFLSVEQRCPDCDFSRKWNSQPILGSTAAGNLQLSVALYATGASFFKLKKIFRAMQLKMINYETFRNHARSYIEPAIVHSWKTAQDGMLQQLRQQQNIVLGGGLRVSLPGHSAKFGSYSVMDLRTSTIIDLQLLQSNEVGGSNYMEKEGLKRSLDVLRAHNVTFDSIVTDRHPQVKKFLRETNITQYYDVWRIEKGLSKKLLRISQSKECEKLRKWLRSIKNHIYWTAAASSSGQERVAKWTSILNHVQNIHAHKDPVFPRCLHPRRISRDKNKWLRAGTPAFCRLEKVLTNKRILKDVEKLSPHHQTSSLEVFHSVIRCFVPKNFVFSFLGMLCRLYLAALHFNENAERPQATTAADYVDNLMDLIFEKVVMDPTPYVDEVPEDLHT
ncbi:uncharacterized protein LOC131530781 isoform X2 [Onychostoma macrolepis]|uniref:uncharacterized protein LOC131530781 isoform X2 n=1 Tax=Onychostoma macrolepis TaxID=369639 RepID=UPI00272DB428|nr:uncharacterized protein LOC131530781 isoform X2 [Onychostoma macrolepis]